MTAIAAESSIRTDRLVLRPIVMDDLDEYTMQYRDPRVTAHLPGGAWQRQEIPIRCTYTVKRFVDHWAQHGFGPFAVTWAKTGGLLGHCGVRHFPVEIPPVPRDEGEGQEVELLYMLGTAYWGKGIAREAVRCSLDHAFGVLGMGRVSAVAVPTNHRSTRVLEAAGLTAEGPRRAFGLHMTGYTVTRVEHAMNVPAA